MRTRILAVFTLLAATTTTALASASPIAEIVCAPASEMSNKMTRMYGNSLHAWGVREPGQVMQIWTGRDGDWTMIVSYATGMSCIVAMGDSWEFIQTENPV